MVNEEQNKEWFYSKSLTKDESMIREYLIEKYYSKNKPGHMIRHIDEVWSDALDILVKLHKENNFNVSSGLITRRVVFFTVYYHEIFRFFSVENYPAITAKNIIYKGDVYIDSLLSENERIVVAEAILKQNDISLDSFNTIDIINFHAALLRVAGKGKPIFPIVLEKVKREFGDEPDTIKKIIYNKYSMFGDIWDDKLWNETYAIYKVDFIRESDRWLEDIIMNDDSYDTHVIESAI